MESDKITFTDEQIQNWKSYEQVRQSGKFNMYDPRARHKAELTEDEYKFCMKHYSELREVTESGAS